jgi:hypothetical protein
MFLGLDHFELERNDQQAFIVSMPKKDNVPRKFIFKSILTSK